MAAALKKNGVFRPSRLINTDLRISSVRWLYAKLISGYTVIRHWYKLSYKFTC